MNYMHVIHYLQEHLYVASNFTMFTATRNFAQTSSNLIPGQPSLETFMPPPTATKNTHLWVTTSFLSLNSKHDFCYVYGDAYSAQTFGIVWK